MKLKWILMGVAALAFGCTAKQDQQKTEEGEVAHPAPQEVVELPAGIDFDALQAIELEDFGVAATSELHAGAMHAETPVSIPGGRVMTTKELVGALAYKTPPLVFDVLGGTEIIPGSLSATPAHAPGNFQDATQQQFALFLEQSTKGKKDSPLVFYCLSTHCWMSYNAALRAINLGYTNVFWYRGGIEAWKKAGQPVDSSVGGFHQ